MFNKAVTRLLLLMVLMARAGGKLTCGVPVFIFETFKQPLICIKKSKHNILNQQARQLKTYLRAGLVQLTRMQGKTVMSCQRSLANDARGGAAGVMFYNVMHTQCFYMFYIHFG